MPSPWYKRVGFEFGISWCLPFHVEPIKKWLFDPEYGYIWPGKIVTKDKLPQEWWKLVTAKENELTSKAYWLHGAIRLLGLDVGIGLMYITE